MYVKIVLVAEKCFYIRSSCLCTERNIGDHTYYFFTHFLTCVTSHKVTGFSEQVQQRVHLVDMSHRICLVESCQKAMKRSQIKKIEMMGNSELLTRFYQDWCSHKPKTVYVHASRSCCYIVRR